ncbi:MAG TPA: XRE family transcriptional regulator [Desulfotomaculum sp.]|nr:MAG: hypothetical protein JL56_02560 [Desulfotomaculum sp. BICA1-6]HBX22583.1 XRE family transcriptional regulator [Desulfotomaculum sp.]
MKRKYYQRYACIARAIKEERQLRGISQEKLADMIGISKSYISKIEAPNCDKTFSLEVLFEIADALKIPLTSLFKYM